MNKSICAILGLILWMWSCTSLPSYPVKSVEPFDKERYLGTWYEIARMDFRFERNLSKVTATYSENTDGTVGVLNKGFNTKTNAWKEAKGKARFKGSTKKGNLEVSFFGPFYSDYYVLAIDPEYQYAFVGGKTTGYMWLLSRSKTMPDKVKQQYLKQAQQLGFDTEKLVWTEH